MLNKIKTRAVIAYNNVGKFFWKKPTIKSIDDTLDYIVINRCSVSRFGDGEFGIILGVGNGFQNYNHSLQCRLSEIIVSQCRNHIVCLPDIFNNLDYLRNESIYFQKGLLGLYRKRYLNILDINKTYYNAFFTRCYNMFRNKSCCKEWFRKNKMIWKNQDWLIVEGKYSRLGIGNDLFADAKSIDRILCPAEDAFSKYEEILSTVKKYGRNKLILIALGMTATVLAYDLALESYWAIDIGHVDIEYEWFLRGATEKIQIDGKYVNEVEGGTIVKDICDSKYYDQIVGEIG